MNFKHFENYWYNFISLVGLFKKKEFVDQIDGLSLG